jgi:hypothetical protein
MDGIAPTQSTGRVSTSAETPISLAILLAVGSFQPYPRIQALAFEEVMTYASR